MTNVKTQNPFTLADAFTDDDLPAIPRVTQSPTINAPSCHTVTISTSDFSDHSLILNDHAVRRFAPNVRKHYTALKTSANAVRDELAPNDTLTPSHPRMPKMRVARSTSLSVFDKTTSIHIAPVTVSVNAPKLHDRTLPTVLATPRTDRKCDAVKSARHFRHQLNQLHTVVHVAQLVNCFSSYFPVPSESFNAECMHTVTFSRSAQSNTVHASHTFYSALSLSHLVASVFSSLHNDHAVYAHVFNCVLTELDASSPHIIENLDHAYPKTVTDMIRSVIDAPVIENTDD